MLGLVSSYVVDESGWIRIDPAVYFIDHLPVHVELLDVAGRGRASFAGRRAGHAASLASGGAT